MYSAFIAPLILNIKTSWFSSLDAKTRIRLRATAFSAADYVVNALILFGCASVGMISYDALFKLISIAVVFNVMFLGGIGFGFTRGFRDPSIIGLQVFVACGLNLLGMLLAPKIAYLFIVNLFVPLAYCCMHFSQRMFVLIWLFLSFALGAVLSTIGDADIMLATRNHRLFFWGVLIIAIARFLLVL